MSKKIVIWLVAAFALLGGAYWLLAGDDEPDAVPASSNQPTTTSPAETSASPQQYATYDEAALGNEFNRHIIFFHAGWCPECRAFEQALLDETLPSDVQILKADYDTATELKQMYGVTIQSTFVEVDSNGELVAKWAGYGEDKSFAAIEQGLSESQ